MTAVKVPDVGTIDFTPARRRAFDVLVSAAKAEAPTAVSNRTDPDRRLVYWQCAEWLEETGLAAARWTAGTSHLELTAVGWHVAYYLDEADR